MITHALGGISVKKKIPQNRRRLCTSLNIAHTHRGCVNRCSRDTTLYFVPPGEKGS